jgi:hypothetical protein
MMVRRSPPREIGLLCGHKVSFHPPIPYKGELVSCVHCGPQPVSDAPQELRVKCGMCRRYGLRRWTTVENAQTWARAHVGKYPAHVARVMDGALEISVHGENSVVQLREHQAVHAQEHHDGLRRMTDRMKAVTET